ncbi:uncharacterized protein TNCV_1999261 [Trichonephila clavipes]|nr:uncharacterized protein TNCV_1999261 [Trichonephila clavipes]
MLFCTCSKTMNLFTSIIGLAEVLIFLSISTRPVTSQGNKTVQQTGFAPRLTNFKLDVHRLLEGYRIRKKRHIRQDEDLENIDPPNHNMRVGKLSQEYKLSYLSDYNLTFWISFEYLSNIQVLIGTQEGQLILFELSENDDKEARTVALSFNENIAIKAMAFAYFEEQWFVILHSSGDTKWIRFYQKIGRGLEGRQMITLDGEADFDLTYIKGVHYLAVVTFRTSPYQSMLTLYHWTRTQFDKIAVRAVLNARSVTCWEMDGNLYMAVAQEMSEEGDFRVGSPVFFYSARDDEGLKLHQMIDTYGPIKVRHFYASGSHYVIIFGRENATIHWWSNDQFLRWQTLERTAYASDASVLALTNGEVMIVITFQEEALFFALDGSGHYILTFAMTLSGNLASLQFMYSKKSYYALAQFEDSRPQSVWKLILDSFSLPTANSLDPLQQCLADVSAILNDRQSNLDDAHYNLGRVWLKNRNQTITSEVIVTGKTSSRLPSIIAYVLVVTEHKILPDSSIPLVENAIAGIKSIIDKIQLSITGSVRKSLKQDILGE